MMTARNTTLREGFDDETCGTLIRATLAAYLPQDRSYASQHPRSARAPLRQADLRAALPRRRPRRSRSRSASTLGTVDLAVGSLVGAGIALQMKLFELAERIPVVRDIATSLLVRQVRGLLGQLRPARFTTDATKYRPAAAAPATAA